MTYPAKVLPVVSDFCAIKSKDKIDCSVDIRISAALLKRLCLLLKSTIRVKLLLVSLGQILQCADY